MIDDVLAEYNGLGYSGTNSGGNLLIVNSRFNNNRAGIVPNSGSYELCYPQRETTIVGNLVYSNNQPRHAGHRRRPPRDGQRHPRRRRRRATRSRATACGTTTGIGIGLVPFPEEEALDDQPSPDEWDTPCAETKDDPVNTAPPESLLWDARENVVTDNVVEDSRIADLAVGVGRPTRRPSATASPTTRSPRRHPPTSRRSPRATATGAGDWTAGALDLGALHRRRRERPAERRLRGGRAARAGAAGEHARRRDGAGRRRPPTCPSTVDLDAIAVPDAPDGVIARSRRRPSSRSPRLAVDAGAPPPPRRVCRAAGPRRAVHRRVRRGRTRRSTTRSSTPATPARATATTSSATRRRRPTRRTKQLLVAPTTCQQRLDTAAYWAPSLLDGDGTPVVPIAATAYYRAGAGVDPATVTAYPPGLLMVGGGTPPSAGWTCRAGSGRSAAPPACAATAGLRLAVTFPDCWDGSTSTATTTAPTSRSQRPAGCPDEPPGADPAARARRRLRRRSIPAGLALSSGGVDRPRRLLERLGPGQAGDRGRAVPAPPAGVRRQQRLSVTHRGVRLERRGAQRQAAGAPAATTAATAASTSRWGCARTTRSWRGCGGPRRSTASSWAPCRRRGRRGSWRRSPPARCAARRCGAGAARACGAPRSWRGRCRDCRGAARARRARRSPSAWRAASGAAAASMRASRSLVGGDDRRTGAVERARQLGEGPAPFGELRVGGEQPGTVEVAAGGDGGLGGPARVRCPRRRARPSSAGGGDRPELDTHAPRRDRDQVDRHEVGERRRSGSTPAAPRSSSAGARHRRR